MKNRQDYNVVMIRSKINKPSCPCCASNLSLTSKADDVFKMVWECDNCFGLFDHKTFEYVEMNIISREDQKYAYKR